MAFLRVSHFQSSNSIASERTRLTRIIFSKILKVYLEYLIICFWPTIKWTVSLKLFFSLTACFSSPQKTKFSNFGTAWKVSSGPCFAVFGLNLENSSVNFRIQAQYTKIRTRKKLRIWTLFTQCGNYRNKSCLSFFHATLSILYLILIL